MRAMLKKEFLEIVRTKKLTILIIVLLFVAVSSPIIAKLIPTIFSNIDLQGLALQIPEPTWRDAIDQFVKNLSQIALVVIVFMFAGTLAEEKNKKTLEIILTKPVARSSFVLAKFVASIASLSLVYLLTALIFYYYSVTLFGGFSLANFVLMALLLLLYLWQVVALTLFCSTFSNSQIVAAGTAFFIEILLVSILGSIDKISRYVPGYILGQYRDLVESGKLSDFVPSTVVSLILIIVLTFFSIRLFQKQEIER